MSSSSNNTNNKTQNKPNDCRHGAPPPESSAYRNAIAFQIEFMKRLETKRAAGEQSPSGLMIITEMISEEQFSAPNNQGLAVALRIITEFFLQSQQHASDSAILPASNLRRQQNMHLSVLWAIEEFTSFMDFMSGDCTTEEEEKYEAEKIRMSKMASKVFKSNLAAAQYVSDRIPCFCLDSLIERMKEQPLTQHCEYCDGETPREELRKCASCMTAEYCSKECQRADWVFHRTECTKLASLRKGEEK